MDGLNPVDMGTEVPGTVLVLEAVASREWMVKVSAWENLEESTTTITHLLLPWRIWEELTNLNFCPGAGCSVFISSENIDAYVDLLVWITNQVNRLLRLGPGLGKWHARSHAWLSKKAHPPAPWRKTESFWFSVSCGPGRGSYIFPQGPWECCSISQPATEVQ